MHKSYSLKTVKEVYSYWGKSLLAYKLGVSFFGFGSYLRKQAADLLFESQTVVDLACGPGIMFKRIEKKIGPEGKLIAVDYVKEMIEQCRKLVKRKNWQNVEIIKADAARLRLKQNSVDIIISFIGLSAIPDHISALRKCKSFLKKGGKLIVLDGKDFSGAWRFLNPALRILRWSKSYQRKNLIKDIEAVFGNIEVNEYMLGSAFIAYAVKK
jgi:ubiquinone/menaquinone biosynthesis C-methylase UbiE